ncbi:MAG: acyl carrier protein [bacterium]|nr:acyl carrier protein [bacterium]
MVTAELKLEIKELIVESLNLADVAPGDIDDGAPLFEQEEVFSMDSLDALEIVMGVQSKYNVRIDNRNLARTVIQSVDTIAQFVTEQQANADAS